MNNNQQSKDKNDEKRRGEEAKLNKRGKQKQAKDKVSLRLMKNL